jgi:hypothetical protein
MMLRHIILVAIVLALIYEKRNQSEEVAGSKNFHLSGGASKQMYLLMHREGMSQENLKKFVQLEDRFLQIERNSVCSGVPHIVEATSLSNLIKDMFPRYNFAYHTIHLKQVAEPTKTVNTKIKC